MEEYMKENEKIMDKNQGTFFDNKDTDGGVISAEEKGKTSKSKRKFVYVSVVCACLLLAIVLLYVVLFHFNHDYARTYSLEPYKKSADATKEFGKNCEKSYQMMDALSKSLPYSGKYSVVRATDEYTEDVIPVDGYPDYYAGKYINVDGKLIILIKENYFKEKYRKCDWYKELVEVLGSEDFGCRPVKYNYTELMNGMSDYVWGSLGRAIKDMGVESSGAVLEEYENIIGIRVKTEADAQKVQGLFSNDMYRTVVEELLW